MRSKMTRRQKTVGSRQKAVGRKPAAYCLLPTAYCHAGFTLLELIITLAVLAIILAGAFPLARNTIQREREIELRRNLREIRQAIDSYKIGYDQNVGPLDRHLDDEGYPTSLEVLVNGITPPNTTRKIRFLRHIPRDPMTGKTEWGFRSVQDDRDSSSWGGQNIFDVYSKSSGTALNGTKYKDW